MADKQATRDRREDLIEDVDDASDIPSYPLTVKQVRHRSEVIEIARRAEKHKQLMEKINGFLIHTIGTLDVVDLEFDRRDFPTDIIHEVLQLFSGKGWRFHTELRDGGKMRIRFIEPPKE